VPNITKDGMPSLASPVPQPNDSISGLLAGENIPAGSACNIRPDGKVWLANGTALNAAARIHGYTYDRDYLAGQPITITEKCRLHYGTALTPGTPLYLSATAGLLSDTATTGGPISCGFVVDDTKISVISTAYYRVP
jgi:hypothetical protein